MIPIPKKILNKIDKRVRKYNDSAKEGTDVKVQQIWYANHNMSDPGDTLFFIIEKIYSDRLEDLLIELDFEIAKENPDLKLRLQTWPCGYEAVEDQGLQEKVFDYVNNKDL